MFSEIYKLTTAAYCHCNQRRVLSDSLCKSLLSLITEAFVLTMMMSYLTGTIILIGAYISVTSALPPCVCTREKSPVCGSDGKTYSNLCLLNCARSTDPSITLARRGKCDNVNAGLNCICTFEYSPVCGTDGETYPNHCSLRCRQNQEPELDMSYRGACRNVRDVEEVCGCKGRETKLVCGTDGITYNNPCLLNCARETNPDLHVLHVNPCEDETKLEVPANRLCACTRNLQPVCASNGVTYSNKCLMKCAGTHLTIKVLAPVMNSNH